MPNDPHEVTFQPNPKAPPAINEKIPEKENSGNTTSGPEDIDQPFKKRRRNMGQKNGRNATRSDIVAYRLSLATSVRETADIAVELGVPRGYADKILLRDARNQIKVMELHKAARRFYRLKAEIKHNALRKRVCTRVAKRAYKPKSH